MPTASVPEPVAAELAPAPQHRWRTRLFQAYLVAAILGFALLFGLALSTPYFVIDLSVTHAVQRYDAAWFTTLMAAVSWPGFAPQALVLPALVCLALFAVRLRWEAVCGGLFAALGASGVGTAVKFIVHRPRPTPDLVGVIQQLDSYSFPSGHVLFYTAFFGFLFYLAYTLLKRSWWRTLLLILLGTLVALVGVSRIALGQHWFSDVLGAYLLGSVWLALTVQVYRWGQDRYFVRQR